MSSTLNILFTDGVFISWKHSFVFFLPQLFLIWFHNFFLQNDLFPTFLVQYGANVHWISLAFSLIMLHTLKCCIVNETNTVIFFSQKIKKWQKNEADINFASQASQCSNVKNKIKTQIHHIIDNADKNTTAIKSPTVSKKYRRKQITPGCRQQFWTESFSRSKLSTYMHHLNKGKMRGFVLIKSVHSNMTFVADI